MTSPAHDEPLGETSGVASEDVDHERKARDEEELKEALQAEAVQRHGETLDRWEAEQPEEVRAAAIAAYVETDTIDTEATGLSADQVAALEAGFRAHVETTIAKPLGLDLDTWAEFVADEDLPAFRKAVVTGDWELLRGHAESVAEHLRQEAQTGR